MSATEIYMNIPAVRDIARQSGVISDVLEQVKKSLYAYTDVLSSDGFTGLVGAAAAAQIIEILIPSVAQTAAKCAELSHDIDASVTAYERGDETGATRYY